MAEDTDGATTSAPLEREKFDAEKGFRERELLIKERDQVVREAELELKRKELASSGWRNPLVLAIILAIVAVLGNACVAALNGTFQRGLEEQRSEQTLILEMIKGTNPDKVAENLRFLLDAGLVSDPQRAAKLGEFLSQRKPGSGPMLPTVCGVAFIKEQPDSLNGAGTVGPSGRPQRHPAMQPRPFRSPHHTRRARISALRPLHD